VQLHSLAITNAAMAVTIDCGEPWNIHPANKQIVADRLIRAALGCVYGQHIEYSGPIYDSMKVTGSQVRLKFDHAGGGLVAKDGPLKQFAIAGADHKFVWADARIEAPDTVVISSDQIKTPVAVRYAFSGNPQGANLFNDAKLPASPFRTDDWELPATPPAH
jgi:sialate O-acetylesterase